MKTNGTAGTITTVLSPPPSVCPTCGRCPTCGNYHPYPYVAPYYPQVTWTTTVASAQ